MSSKDEIGDKTFASERTENETCISTKSNIGSRVTQKIMQPILLTAKTMIESTTSSLERRACRICQSETGEMVRPCGCSGTMGDIHEHCLSTWVSTSNKNKCEICKEEYAKSGWIMKGISEWSKPKIGPEDIISVLVLLGLMYSIFYMLCLFEERRFMERVSNRMPIRSDDYGRLFTFIMIVTTFLAFLLGLMRQIREYFVKQREIRFTNKESV